MKLLLLLAALVGYASAACDLPYHQVDDMCVYVEETEVRDYAGAREFCAEIAGNIAGADLASPSTCDRLTHLSRYLELNIANPDTQMFYVGAHKISSGWYWVDLQSLPLGPPFWAYDKGNMVGMDCATVDGFRDYKLSCSQCLEQRHFICEVPPHNEPKEIKETLKPKGDGCGEGGVQMGDFCYMFYAEEETWEEAEKICQEVEEPMLNGALFYPSDCEEYTLLARHIAAVEPLGDYWVGAVDTTGNQAWTWADGVEVPSGIPYWAFDEPSHPNDGFPRKHCGLLSAVKSWYLSDALCQEAHFYICKMEVGVVPPQ